MTMIDIKNTQNSKHKIIAWMMRNFSNTIPTFLLLRCQSKEIKRQQHTAIRLCCAKKFYVHFQLLSELDVVVWLDRERKGVQRKRRKLKRKSGSFVSPKCSLTFERTFETCSTFRSTQSTFLMSFQNFFCKYSLVFI